MSTTRIALTIAGGVSLGSFEGGALSEILFQLDRLNGTGDHDFRIDVITGGSAGSMTGAIVARMLMQGHDETTRQLLHRAWVTDTGIDELADGPVDTTSLLSSRHLHELARTLLVGGSGGVRFPGRPSSLAPECLRLWFSLTNLVGVTYPAAASQPTGGLPVTTARDSFRTVLRRGEVHDPEHWQRIADGAIASGSHPAAFPPKQLQRSRADYDPAPPPELNPVFERRGGWMSYYDGGVFNNEPIGPAISLAKQQDGGALEPEPSRRFVLIDPRANANATDPEFAGPQPYLASLLRLASLTLTQAAAKQWALGDLVEIDRRGDNAEAIDELVVTLYDAVSSAGAAAAVTAALDRLTPYPAAEPPSESAIAAIRRQVLAGRSLAQAPKRDDALLNALIRALCGRTDLGRRRATVHSITARPCEVQGDELMGFLGFFDREWRQHDWALGRARTRVRLQQIFEIDEMPPEQDPTGRGGGYYEYRETPAVQVGPRDAPTEKVEAFVHRVGAALEKALREDPLRWGRLLADAGGLGARYGLRRLFERPTDCPAPSPDPEPLER